MKKKKKKKKNAVTPRCGVRPRIPASREQRERERKRET
jgi:hypothetical protein